MDSPAAIYISKALNNRKMAGIGGSPNIYWHTDSQAVTLLLKVYLKLLQRPLPEQAWY